MPRSFVTQYTQAAAPVNFAAVGRSVAAPLVAAAPSRHHSEMSDCSRHRLSLQRLAHGAGLPWLARMLALLLVLGNAFAAVAPVKMLAMAAPAPGAAHAMHHAMAMASMDSGESVDSMAAMHHDHAATSSPDSSPDMQNQHGNGCACCNNGHCGCLQACSPLPMLAAAALAPLPLSAESPVTMSIAPPGSISGAPPLRPPIA